MAIEGDRAIGSLGDDLTWHEKTDQMSYSRYSGTVPLAVKRKAILGPVDIHLSQITAATRNSIEANESTVFS
jgi:hypothetical protein